MLLVVGVLHMMVLGLKCIVSMCLLLNDLYSKHFIGSKCLNHLLSNCSMTSAVALAFKGDYRT